MYNSLGLQELWPTHAYSTVLSWEDPSCFHPPCECAGFDPGADVILFEEKAIVPQDISGVWSQTLQGLHLTTTAKKWRLRE